MKPLPDIQQLLQQLDKLPLQRVQPWLNLLLVILLAWLLARFSWQLVPTPAATALTPAISSAGSKSAGSGVSLPALTGFALFGKASSEPVKAVQPVVTEAPKTQLNVKLTGVVALPADPAKGSAIIESRGSEATYAVDDTIEGTNAVLKQVLADRVLLLQAGRFETLMLDGIEYTKIAQANAGLGRADELVAVEDNGGDLAPVPEPMEMQPLELSEELDIRRDELIAEPMKFFDYIRVSPHRPQGQLLGYRLMPGKDATLFTQLGLQPNDLAIEINGIALTDMQQAMNVINELRDAKEAAIKIERDGEIRDILVSLSQ
ncbi:type II secretion system protein GspC [Rheinheimera nanhaiensis]|uniref:General secretion pathway protein C n=1 Tax=Rheinheimera nanhaiensis E407-8 TaxID=562729 RepID=I1E160_9GAMM|nr:type II secretion system protein GspC [Rheinheimera nanhaiensis]GAB60038.1 general secretion pathway protein C [Rheinheimera nanhaiensis E407-8]